MSAANKSVLQDIQERNGATFMQDGDWYWMVSAGDVQAEYAAIRTGVSIWDVYALQKWDVTGPDARRALQHLFTNNLATMAVGQVRYGAFVDDAGKMIDDGTIYKHADDHYWAMTNSDVFGDDLAAANPGLEFTATHRTHEMPVISVQGPRGTIDFTPSRTRPSSVRVAVVAGSSTSNSGRGSVSASAAAGTSSPVNAGR